jgi:hypothetical protein
MVSEISLLIVNGVSVLGLKFCVCYAICIFKGMEIVACVVRSMQDLRCSDDAENGIYGMNVDVISRNISVALVSSGLSFADEKSSRPLVGVGLVHVFHQS